MITGGLFNTKLFADKTPPMFGSYSTQMGPVVKTFGAVTVIEVLVLAVTCAELPFQNKTEPVLLKFFPVMVTVEPGGPEVGLKPMMVGTTIKLVDDVATPPFVRTEILPVSATLGTVIASDVSVAAVTVAAKPLSQTALSAGVVLKLVPVRVTVAPAAA